MGARTMRAFARAASGLQRDMRARRYTFTTQRDLRRFFWAQHPELSRRKLADGDYVTDTRVAWVDWIDALQKAGEISEALAQRATL